MKIRKAILNFNFNLNIFFFLLFCLCLKHFFIFFTYLFFIYFLFFISLQILKEEDPEYYKMMKEKGKDINRITRAISVMRYYKKPFSEFEGPNQHEDGKNYDFRCVFVSEERMSLFKKIDKRCEKMILNGLVEECGELISMGCDENSPVFRSIGYSHCYDYLTLNKKFTRAAFFEFLNKFQSKSRQFSTSQITFFKKLPQFKWINYDDHVVDHIVQLYNIPLEQFQIVASDNSLNSPSQKLMKTYQTKLNYFDNRELVESVLLRSSRVTSQLNQKNLN